jgi:imidazolonepropionase-like amidohydrolase
MPRVLSVLALLLALGFTAGVAEAGDLAIVHARIYPSPHARPIADGTVVVRDGKVAMMGPAARVRIPRGAQVIDAHGDTVTAGFWNSHVHLMTPDLLKADTQPSAVLSNALESMFTRWGFTTVFDIASQLSNANAIRRRIAGGEVIGPKILTVGDAFYPDGGTPIYVKAFMKDNGFPDWEIHSLPAAEARERQELADGADGEKLFIGAIVGGKVGVLQMPTDQAAALARIAHAAGKPVFAHPSNTAGVENAMAAGVDILAHTTPMTGPWSPELVAQVKAHHMALIPTLTLFEVEAKKFGESDADLKTDLGAGVQQVKAYSDAGGQILFGTDVGYTDAFDTTEEYRLMSRALDWRQILATLTVNPAERFGYAAHKGRVTRGMDADLVVLDGDPAKDVTAFARVRDTIRAGKVIYAAK